MDREGYAGQRPRCYPAARPGEGEMASASTEKLVDLPAMPTATASGSWLRASADGRWRR